MNDNNDSDNDGGAEISGVAIAGMHMLSGHCRKSSGGDSMQEDKVPGDNNKEDKDEEEQDHNQEEAARLTKNMSVATEKLNLSLLDGEQEQDEDKKFDYAINKEDGINLLSDDEGGKDFLEEIQVNTTKISHSLVMITTPCWKYPQVYLTQSIPTRPKYQITSKSLYGTKPDPPLGA
jgi:hypothetical protein